MQLRYLDLSFVSLFAERLRENIFCSMHFLPNRNLEDENILDQQDAALTTGVETPNTFGRNLLRRLGLAQGSEAEATGTSSNKNRNFLRNRVMQTVQVFAQLVKK